MAKIINGSSLALALADYLCTNAYLNDTAQDVLIMVGNWIDEAQEITVPKWIPVSERLPEELPKDNCEWSERVRPSVDVLVKMKGSKQLYTAWYSYSHKDWIDVREEHCFRNVTHWMPLPNPPKEDN